MIRLFYQILLLKPIYRFLLLPVISLMISAVSACTPTQPTLKKAQNLQAQVIQAEPVYKVYNLPKSTVHTLTIPANSPYEVTVAVSPSLETVKTVAEKQGAIAAINAGFFDPINSKTTSYIIHQGQMIADPKQNERLMKNPDLTRYLTKILNRSEWRRYQCDATVRYSITFHNDPTPAGCKVLESVGGGPRLLKELTAQTEGFIDSRNGTIIKDALGINQPNARTAIAITPDGVLIWVMAAQKPNSSNPSGLSLIELAEFMKTLGVQEALNLDGGSSSTFYYQGQLYKGKLDQKGNFIERPVKSFLILQKK